MIGHLSSYPIARHTSVMPSFAACLVGQAGVAPAVFHMYEIYSLVPSLLGYTDPYWLME
jgi:hypothetical protein